MRDLRLSRSSKFYGIWRRTQTLVVLEASKEEHVASIFKLQEIQERFLLHSLTPENEGTIVLGNAGRHSTTKLYGAITEILFSVTQRFRGEAVHCAKVCRLRFATRTYTRHGNSLGYIFYTGAILSRRIDLSLPKQGNKREVNDWRVSEGVQREMRETLINNEVSRGIQYGDLCGRICPRVSVAVLTNCALNASCGMALRLWLNICQHFERPLCLHLQRHAVKRVCYTHIA
jgi:hypothetical protein